MSGTPRNASPVDIKILNSWKVEYEHTKIKRHERDEIHYAETDFSVLLFMSKNSWELIRHEEVTRFSADESHDPFTKALTVFDRISSQALWVVN